jgi:DNA polymerase-4
MNSFFASVELLDRPELASLPVAVCGDPENRRGIILAKNEGAKAFGIVTAETIYSARKKCPELVLLPVHHDKYADYCHKINEIYYRFTDLVEPFSIDESWLDVTKSRTLFGEGEEIAYRIKATIRQELNLTQSIGVSYNKIFAKMGSDYKKPDAVTVITRDNYKDLLWPMPVKELFGAGRATAKKLNEMGVKTIGDLAKSDKKLLSGVFGKQGELLFCYANGLEDSAVRSMEDKRAVKSVGNGITFKRDLVGEDDIMTALDALADTVSSKLRKYGYKCMGVKVDIKDPDFKTISRQAKLPKATNLSEVLRMKAAEIVKKSWSINAPIRLITLTAINLTGEDVSEQLDFLDSLGADKDELFMEDAEREESLERTMDKIREKYGDASISWARIIGSDIGLPHD